jgi:hypothetical protein
MGGEICVNCMKRSPETDSDYTLLSSQHGWRLMRTKAASGVVLREWRCPSCWGDFKRAHPEISSGVSARPSSVPPGSVARKPK